MHGYALQRRLQNVGITVSSLHPGSVSIYKIIIKYVLHNYNRLILKYWIKEWLIVGNFVCLQ